MYFFFQKPSKVKKRSILGFNFFWQRCSKIYIFHNTLTFFFARSKNKKGHQRVSQSSDIRKRLKKEIRKKKEEEGEEARKRRNLLFRRNTYKRQKHNKQQRKTV